MSTIAAAKVGQHDIDTPLTDRADLRSIRQLDADDLSFLVVRERSNQDQMETSARRKFVMTGKPTHVRTLCLVLLTVVFSGCASGPSKSRRGVGRVFKDLAVSTISLGRQRKAEQRYVEAIELLDGEPGFTEIVAVAREAERAHHHGEPEAVALFAQVALDCWPKLTTVTAVSDPEAEPPRVDGELKNDRAVWELYHHSVAEFVRNAQLHGSMDSGKLVTLANEEGESIYIPIAHQGFPWTDEDFNALRLAASSDPKVLKRYWREPGLGVPLVAVRQRDSSDDYIGKQVPFSATCILRPILPDEAGASLSLSSDLGAPAVLELKDPLRVQQVSYRSRQWKLARDLSAPLAIATKETDRHKLLSFLHPGRMDDKGGLRMIEPYQPGKIPLVFVHGLLSDRFTWADLVNDLRYVPGFNEHYQIWSFQYPTGQVFIRSAAELRASLRAIVQHLDPGGTDEALAQMVLVGHSMGGLVSKLQVSHSGTEIWDSVASRGVDEIKATPEVRGEIEKLFFFKPSPYVKRVIFIGSPHLGSEIATSFVGKLGTALVKIPTEREVQFESFVENNPHLFVGKLSHHLPTSIDLLRPDNPILLAAYKLRVNSAVRLHTIIGTGRELSDGIPADGVVSVESARHPGTVSEFYIDATHTQLTGHEETTKELLRILGQHVGELEAVPTEPDARVAGVRAAATMLR